MHRTRPILVLPNAWDVESAKRLAALSTCRALATTSGGVARSLGHEDGEQAPAREMIEVAARIATAVDIPVTADLERGYGEPLETARAAWEAGVVGVNIEDSTASDLVSENEQVELIRELRSALPELVLNARVDVFLAGSGAVDEAVIRANAYLAAGADCAYPITCPPYAVAELARQIEGPVNVLLRPDMPGPRELERLGVARVTFGSRLAAVAYDAAVREAERALNDPD
jgi:2-methylisocitrate lyase-like PEP mutase family enzyme